MLKLHLIGSAMKAMAYAGSIAIIVLSLIPSALRPHTGAGGDYEHFLAYMLVGFAFGLGYRETRAHLIVGFALSAGAAFLEILQNFVPGRTPELAGFFASSAGSWAGLASSIALLVLIRRKCGRLEQL